MADDIPESDRLDDLPHPRERYTLAGHDWAEHQFLDAYRGGKLHHAWILGGPKGIGKATLAYRAARFVLRHPHPGEVPADTADLTVDPADPVARRITSLGHADLLVLRRPWDHKTKQLKTVLSVDEVRRASGFFSRTAGEGGWRVCIVDAADEMNVNAANALLKILEEPPARCLFLLVTHVPGRLLPTIRSRCRRLDLQPLDPADAAAVMADVLAQAGEKAKPADLALHRDLVAVMESMPGLDLKKLHKLADELASRQARDRYGLFTTMLVDWLAAMVRTAATGDAGYAAPDEAAAMARLAGTGDLGAWAEAYEKIGHSIARANGLNLDRKQVILTLFFSLDEIARGSRAA
jgi:DNA polymerase-3 subunit delta'